MSLIKNLITSLFIVLLSACGSQSRDENEIYLGTISGPETELMKTAQMVAKTEYGLNIKIISFEDYIMPNLALAEKDIDANMFQHQPYLDVVLAKKNYPLVSIGKMFIYPMGIYSKKYPTLDAIPAGATIGIPNDPSNGARALRLLAVAGLIEVPSLNDFALTPKQISANPKGLVIKELPAAQLPRVLAEIDAAVINTNFAIPAGLKPQSDALKLESKDSPYANVIVVRQEDKDLDKFKRLIKALHSQAVIDKANELFPQHAIAAWHDE